MNKDRNAPRMTAFEVRRSLEVIREELGKLQQEAELCWLWDLGSNLEQLERLPSCMRERQREAMDLEACFKVLALRWDLAALAQEQFKKGRR